MFTTVQILGYNFILIFVNRKRIKRDGRTKLVNFDEKRRVRGRKSCKIY